jgi:uncharacterized repeat protein (TIGR01451 family)
VEGAGIYVDSSSLEARHTTLARNTGPSGLSVARHAGEASQASLANTILVSHTIGVTVSEGAYATLEATLWGTGAWANDRDTDGAGTLVTGTLNLWQEPGFAPGRYHLGINSPAVDAGTDAGLSSDLDGQPRPHLDGFDLGADEWWPLWVVKQASPDLVSPGQLVTYSLRLTNTTLLSAAVHLTDPLPSEVAFVGPLQVSHGDGGYRDGVITWTGTLSPGVAGWLQWPVSITLQTPYSTTVTNRALIDDPFGVYWTEPARIYLPPQRVLLPVALK